MTVSPMANHHHPVTRMMGANQGAIQGTGQSVNILGTGLGPFVLGVRIVQAVLP